MVDTEFPSITGQIFGLCATLAFCIAVVAITDWGNVLDDVNRGMARALFLMPIIAFIAFVLTGVSMSIVWVVSYGIGAMIEHCAKQLVGK